MTRTVVFSIFLCGLTAAAGLSDGAARAELDDAARQDAHRKAQYFIDQERQFHLGVLPTEQSHPKTARLAETARSDLAAAVRMLQSVDAELPGRMGQILRGPEFRRLAGAINGAIRGKGRVCFSGCGATGRLSILLEARWRQFWQDARGGHPAIAARLPDLEGRVVSIMTGGDYALIRSVENFEDYAVFGRRQVQELRLGRGDVLVAISEGGETSSVIGTIWQALENGAQVFFLFNNPAAVLARHVERSRQVIEDARVTKLDLSCGPMAVAGSTRMQATTSELLVAGTALETALAQMLQARLDAASLAALEVTLRRPDDYVRLFERLLADLGSPQSVAAIAAMADDETRLYRRHGLVTYVADRCLLDIFTDTTERSPTFMLPRFRRGDDGVSPPPWAFVKHARLATPDAWQAVLRRTPRCLGWNSATYRELGAPAAICAHPPRLSAEEMRGFLIGNEDDNSRFGAAENAVTLVVLGDEIARLAAANDPLRNGFEAIARRFRGRGVLAVGPAAPPAALAANIWHVPVRAATSPLRLWERLSVKLVLNTASTASMARLGRLTGNWMTHVEPTNKKLIDRGTRIVSELAGVDYKAACYALYETMEEQARTSRPGQQRASPVALCLERLRHKQAARPGQAERIFAYRSFNPELKTVKAFAGFGVDTVCIYPSNTLNSLGMPYNVYGPTWLGRGRYDFGPLDKQIADLCAVNPRVKLICMIDLNTPAWWTHQHISADSFTELGRVAADQGWRKETGAYLEAFLRHAEERYRDLIWGYQLACGGTCEWYDLSHGSESRARRAAFRAWALRHGMPDPIDIPAASVRDHVSHDLLRDPERDRLGVEYWRFCNWQIGDAILYYAQAAQKVIRHRVKLGVFYGYIPELGQNRLVSHGHLGYPPVFASPELDYFAAPATGHNREMGGASGFLSPVGSIQLHGKAFLQELDHRTSTARSGAAWYTAGFALWHNEAEDVAGLRRELAYCLTEGVSLWWFDMWGGFYDGAAVRTAMAQMKRIWDEALRHEDSPAAQIALVVDPESALYMDQSNPRVDDFMPRLLQVAGHSGAPYKVFSFEDLATLDLSPYKLVIFPDLFVADKARREVIARRVCGQGRTVLWFYRPGVIRDGKYDERNVAELTGIPLDVKEATARAMPGWTSVLAPAPTKQAAELRRIARRAGVHVYSDTDEPLYASRNLVALHTATGGLREIRLPRRCRVVRELFSGRIVARDADRFSDTLAAPATVLYALDW
jgi:N-acetylmuramic acid 6-phosphate etherase